MAISKTAKEKGTQRCVPFLPFGIRFGGVARGVSHGARFTTGLIGQHLSFRRLCFDGAVKASPVLLEAFIFLKLQFTIAAVFVAIKITWKKIHFLPIFPSCLACVARLRGQHP